MEEALQLPDVLQQVALTRHLAQRLPQSFGAISQTRHVLQQRLLLL